MPVFEYKGYTQAGANTSGIIDADNPKEARAKLKGQGIMAVDVHLETSQGEIKRNPFSTVFNRIGVKEISGFTRQLETLQDAGLPLLESLESVIEQADNLRFKKVLSNVRDSISSGASLAESLRSQGSHFDTTYVNLVKAGEASGALGVTLGKLADFNENSHRRRTAIISAMAYPAIVSAVCAGVLIFLLGYVAPKTNVMFEDMDQALPMVTIIMLTVSGVVAKWWAFMMVGAVAAGAGFYKYIQSPAGEFWFDGMIIHLPFIGPVVRAAVIGRFAGSMELLLSSGVDMLEALAITRDSLGNQAYSKVMDEAIKNVTEGKSMAESMKRSTLFPPVTVQMVAAGERGGALEKMLRKIAAAYDYEMETRINIMTKALEPTLILVMGFIVGFVVLSILLPIFELSQIIK